MMERISVILEALSPIAAIAFVEAIIAFSPVTPCSFERAASPTRSCISLLMFTICSFRRMTLPSISFILNTAFSIDFPTFCAEAASSSTAAEDSSAAEACV
ncbi:hypothetical protein LKM2_3580 [Leptospira kirschneri serovar Mozdok]|nr:hypothetical protein [Leptospira kirschneri serovar Mozdok]